MKNVSEEIVLVGDFCNNNKQQQTTTTTTTTNNNKQTNNNNKIMYQLTSRKDARWRNVSDDGGGGPGSDGGGPGKGSLGGPGKLGGANFGGGKCLCV